MASPFPELPPLIGQSPPFLELMERTSSVAPLDRPVLVVGERGTGKELVAAQLHYLSKRWEGPLVKINCAALAESLLESELFGHELGAFTGAARRRAGRFERADGGTLFLDEIASASLAVQEKVLRVIEYGEFERLGSSAAIYADVRVIGAANVDLPGAAAAGRFRHDLLDRLAFEVLDVPPLRARRDDIGLLADHFARGMAREMGWPDFPGFTPEVGEAFLDHPWPGNVRQLKNVAERAVYLWDDPETPIATVRFDPFASPYRLAAQPQAQAATVASAEPPPDTARPFDLRARVAAFEKRLIEDSLAATRHRQRAAARHLGLTYDQLRNRIRKHGIM